MHFPSHHLLFAAALVASTLAACESTDTTSAATTGTATTGSVAPAGNGGSGGATTSSSGTAGAGGSAASGTGGSGPVPAPFGLDARPPNPTCLAPDRPPSAPVGVTWEPVFTNLSITGKMGITQIPGDPSRFFVFRRSGTVVSFPAVNPASTTTVLTIPKVVNASGEGGLLGFAFHPKFLTNGHAFFSYTTDGGAYGMRSVVARMTSSDGGKTFGAYKEILIFDQEDAGNHKGGDVHFGNDGYLYLSFGDGGPGGDPNNHGQNTATFFSKILRIDVDGGDPYAIPAGNPFAVSGGEPATFAYGFRNPFRFSIDRESGDLWVADVGQGGWEEIDAKVVAGGNYGWKIRQGKHCYSPPNNCPTAGLIDPFYEYPNVGGASITGGVVYRGKAIPEYVGKYLYADYVTQGIWSLAVDPETGMPAATQINTAGPNAGWVGFGEDNDGEVYIVSLTAGPIYKLVPDGAMPPPSTFPDLLSETGCVDPLDATKPAPGLIPYAAHSQLWSDGAEKDRYLAIPDGTTVTINADGDFDFPIGSVLMKSFRVDGKLVETRLFVRHEDGGWAGYTYEWDDQEKDAAVLPANKKKPLPGGKDWYYPSRSECFTCHNSIAGKTLGLELGQLNADFVYTSTNRISNQLSTLEHIGMFAAPLPGTVDTLVKYPDPTSAEGTVETRARSYLHANCSFCHAPNGIAGAMDLRYATPTSMIDACGVSPSGGDLGVPGSKLVTPGDPSHSVMSLRMKATGAGRMPPLATSVVDADGTAAIDAWIQSLATCP